MKKSLKNLNRVMCHYVRSVFKEDDDCCLTLENNGLKVVEFLC